MAIGTLGFILSCGGERGPSLVAAQRALIGLSQRHFYGKSQSLVASPAVRAVYPLFPALSEKLNLNFILSISTQRITERKWFGAFIEALPATKL